MDDAGPKSFTYAIEIDVFKIEGVDVAWEVAVLIHPVLARAGIHSGWREVGGEEATYPRHVRQMLMRRSAPQPAMRKTPTGGTGDN